MYRTDIAQELNSDKSGVSGRFNELINEGRLTFVDKRPSKTTGRKAKHYRIATESERVDFKIAEKRYKRDEQDRKRENISQAGRTLGEQSRKGKKHIKPASTPMLFPA